MSDIDPYPAQVSCYSGHTYAERPDSFWWQGDRYKVADIKKQWLEPGQKHFLVRTEDEKTFELCYFEGEDNWSLIEIEV